MGALETHCGTGPLRADADTITGQLARRNDLLGRDVAQANALFRAYVAPIICAPIRDAGRKFYGYGRGEGGWIIKGAQLRGRFDLDALRGPAITEIDSLGRAPLLPGALNP